MHTDGLSGLAPEITVVAAPVLAGIATEAVEGILPIMIICEIDLAGSLIEVKAAKALRQGLGTSTNLVEAYAWLKLFSETSAGSIVGRVEMNELALKLDSSALRQAQNLAAQFKAGNWQPPVTRAIPEADSRLKLNGITFGDKIALAVINGKTLSEGESAKIYVKPGTLNIKCLKIEKDSVLVAVEGENAPRLLRLR